MACIPGATPLEDAGVTARAAGRGAVRRGAARFAAARRGARARGACLRDAGFDVFFLVFLVGILDARGALA